MDYPLNYYTSTMVGTTLGIMKWKIVDNEKAKELHLEELSGTLVIHLAGIPSGMSIEEYLNFIQEKNVVIMGLQFIRLEHLLCKQKVVGSRPIDSTLVSVFHNVELLLEPSFGQLEVKETALSMLFSSVVKNSSLTRKRS